jgi:hypothetical protein
VKTVEDGELRYFIGEDEKVASPQEEALINKKIAELEAARADQEMRWAEQLAIKLRELGVDPDAI